MKQLSFVVLVCAVAGLAQTPAVVITSPAANQVVQSITLPLAIALSNAPTTYRVCYLVNDRPTNPENCAYSAPWSLTWYPYLISDGQATVQAAAYDIFGTPLAQSSKVSFNVRSTGFPDSMTGAPTTGASGAVVAYLGNNPGNTQLFVDGVQAPTSGVCAGNQQGLPTGVQWLNFPTWCYVNGPHELFVWGINFAPDEPVNPANTFTPTSVAGSNITLNQPGVHNLVNNRPVTFTTSGALPACSNCTGGSLKPGGLWGWRASATSPNTVTNIVVSGGTAVATLSGNPNSPAWLNVHNIQKWDINRGAPLCEGRFSVTASTTNTVTWTMPNCPDGTYNTGGIEVDTNPYYATYVDNNTVQFSEAPGGAPIAFTSGGSGTHTANYRITSGWWWNFNGIGMDSLNGLPQWGYARQLVTFSNGNHAMEIRPPYWELHLVAGGSPVSVCPKIYNTDLSSTAIACGSAGYSAADDGGYSGVATVDANGNVTPVNVGWSKITVTCSTCNAGGALPSVIVYVQVHSGSVTYPHFARNGTVLTAYNPAQSFIPHSMWHLEPRAATPDITDPTLRSPWLGLLMQDSGINVGEAGLFTDFADPSAPGAATCHTFPTQRDIYIRQFANQYGIAFEYDASVFTGNPIYLWALQKNITFNRQACGRSYIQDIQNDARNYRFFLSDELNGFIGGTAPNRNGLIGQGMLTSISFNSSGLATLTGRISLSAPAGISQWAQATGQGEFIKLTGSTDPRLNGVFAVLSIPARDPSSGDATSITFQTSCASCPAHNAGNDAALLLDYFPFTNRQAIIPTQVQISPAVQQTWSTAFTQITSDHATPSTLTVTCTACGYTGTGLTGSDIIHIQQATNTGLNTLGYATFVNANTFTVPAQTMVPGGPFNSSTDASLILWRDIDLPTSTWTTMRNIVSGTTLVGPILGASYTNLPNVNGWAGDARLTPGASACCDAALNYNPGSVSAIYGEDGSISSTISDYYNSNLYSRAYQFPQRGALYGAGPEIVRFCRGWNFTPGCDHPQNLYWRPATLVASIMTAATRGERSFRGYNYQGNKTGEYAVNPGGGGGAKSIAPDIIPKQWNALAHIFNLFPRIAKYHLEPEMNKPYYGPMFSTDAHTSSYGNELMIVCLADGGATYQQTVDLTPYRIPGGSLYRASLTGYRLMFTPLAGNPTSDTYNFCAADAGETVVYVAQPPGAQPDLDLVTFSPPATLPFGATRMAIRVGYYGRAMNDNPAVDCTGGCTIPVDHYNADAWYQIIYLDSNNLVKSIGDPLMIAKSS